MSALFSTIASNATQSVRKALHDTVSPSPNKQSNSKRNRRIYVATTAALFVTYYLTQVRIPNYDQKHDTMVRIATRDRAEHIREAVEATHLPTNLYYLEEYFASHQGIPIVIPRPLDDNSKFSNGTAAFVQTHVPYRESEVQHTHTLQSIEAPAALERENWILKTPEQQPQWNQNQILKE